MVPDPQPMIPPIDEPGDPPTFPNVEWDDQTSTPAYTDGTAYLQVLAKDAQGIWQGTNSFLLLCNVNSTDPTQSHLVAAGSSHTSNQEYVVINTGYNADPNVFIGLEGFRVWFWSPDRGNIWMCFDWTLNANQANPNITSIKIEHTDPQNPQGQDQDVITLSDVRNSLGSVADKGTLTPSVPPPASPQPPAYGADVVISGG